jgi:hypothetical protein
MDEQARLVSAFAWFAGAKASADRQAASAKKGVLVVIVMR